MCMGVREDNFVTTAAVGPGAAEPINAQCNFCESSDRNFELLSCKNKRRTCLKRSSREAAIPIAGGRRVSSYSGAETLVRVGGWRSVNGYFEESRAL